MMVHNLLSLPGMTIRELEKSFIDQLSASYGFEEAHSLAWLSISHVCRLSRTQYLNAKQNAPSMTEEALLLKVLEELKTGKPLQYVLGETEFYGLPFKVNPSVLIPRPETEELVDWIIKDLKSTYSEFASVKIIDIGTGSGCIPIALQKNIPAIQAFGIDISKAALDTANTNSALNNSEAIFFNDDIFNITQPQVIESKYNLIISNPPYVTYAEKEQMHRNVLAFEPHNALFVSNDDPLIFYRAIVLFALTHLKENGKLFLEINENLGTETVSLLSQYGFENIELRSDLRGRPRMIKAGMRSTLSKT